MFYIGSTTTIKINNGYHGSVSSKEYKTIWENELKHSTHLFKTKIITYHHSRKEAYQKELYFHIKKNVINNSMYSNKANANGSGRFGGGFKNKFHSVEHKEYMKLKYTKRDTFWLSNIKKPEHSKLMSGNGNPMYGRTGENNPLYNRKRNDRFCCIYCKYETINSNFKHHLKCSTLFPI